MAISKLFQTLIGFVIAISVVASSVQASSIDVPEIQINSVQNGVGYRLSSFIISSEAQLQHMQAEVKRRVARLKRVKPQTSLSVVAVNLNERNSSVETSANEMADLVRVSPELIQVETTASNQSQLKRFRQLLSTQKSLITMTLVTSVATGGATTMAMIYSDSLSPSTSIGMGLIWASVSGGYMFFNEQFQTWLRKTSRLEQAIIEKLQLKNPKIISGLKNSGEWGKYFLHIAGWNAVGVIASSMAEKTVLATPMEVLVSSLSEVVSGAPWELAIAAETERAKERHPEKSARIQYFSNMAVMVNEVLAQSLSVASLTGLRTPALVGLSVLAVTGGIYYIHTLLKDQKQSPARSCRRLYSYQSGPISPIPYAA